jgi:hypothetical protein
MMSFIVLGTKCPKCGSPVAKGGAVVEYKVVFAFPLFDRLLEYVVLFPEGEYFFLRFREVDFWVYRFVHGEEYSMGSGGG